MLSQRDIYAQGYRTVRSMPSHKALSVLNSCPVFMTTLKINSQSQICFQ